MVWSILLFGTMAHAGLWDSATSVNTKDIQPDFEYMVKTNGYDPKIYEFTPKSNTRYFCTMIIVQGKSPTLYCMPKGIE